MLAQPQPSAGAAQESVVPTPAVKRIFGSRILPGTVAASGSEAVRPPFRSREITSNAGPTPTSLLDGVHRTAWLKRIVRFAGGAFSRAALESGRLGIVTHLFLAGDHCCSVPRCTPVTMKPCDPWPRRCDGVSSTVFLSDASSITVCLPLTLISKLVAALRIPDRLTATAVTSCTPLASCGALSSHAPVFGSLFTRPAGTLSIATFTHWPRGARPRSVGVANVVFPSPLRPVSESAPRTIVGAAGAFVSIVTDSGLESFPALPEASSGRTVNLCLPAARASSAGTV